MSFVFILEGISCAQYIRMSTMHGRGRSFLHAARTPLEQEHQSRTSMREECGQATGVELYGAAISYYYYLVLSHVQLSVLYFDNSYSDCLYIQEQT